MGDFQANFTRPDAGIRTVEGNVAGSRAGQLERKRQRDQEAFEDAKQQRARQAAATTIAHKFAGGTTTQQDKAFSQQTVGLVTAEQFRKLEQQKGQDDDVKAKNEQNQATAAELQAQQKAAQKAAKRKRKERKKMLATLSFGGDEELQDEDDDTKKTSKKDPSVDTSFLPDQERDRSVEAKKLKLEQEWKEKQEAIKKEKLQITYSYWDGSGHRRNVVCEKGDSIGDFLQSAAKDLSSEFRELASIAPDALLYVKEDLILPQDLTFYDLIATKARGKSGPLFHFDVHDDVRLGAIDSRIEKDESHPGKIVERRWYERNKHIFPASKWCLGTAFFRLHLFIRVPNNVCNSSPDRFVANNHTVLILCIATWAPC